MLRFCSRNSWDRVFPCKLPFWFHPPIWWGSQDAFQKVQWRCLSLLPQCLLLFVTIPCQALNAAWFFFFWSSGTSTYLLFWKYCIVHFEAGGEWHFDYYPKQIMGSTTKQQHEQLLNCRELLQKSLTATNVFNFIIIQMLHTALVPILISVWHYCCVAVHTRIEHRVANPSWGLCWGQPQRACFVVLGFFLTNQSDMIHSLYSSETLWLIQRCPGLEVNGRLSMDFIRSWIHPTVN